MTDKKREYLSDYVKEKQRQFMLKLSKVHETDMIDWLESKPAIQTYLKELIRADMEKSSSVPDLKQ